MAIEVVCSKCGQKCRVPDQYAGKRIKCPKCQAPAEVPALAEPAAKPEASATAVKPAASKPAREVASLTPPPPAAPKVAAAAKTPAPSSKPAAASPVRAAQWHLQTEEGQEYGPVSKEELDRWVVDGRIDTSCQLLQEGWEQWKWASEVYDQLAHQATVGEVETEPEAAHAAPVDDGDPLGELFGGSPDNPYTSPTTVVSTASVAASGPSVAGITPAILKDFKSIRPLTLALSIIGFVLAGLAALVALGNLVRGAAGIIPALVSLAMAGVFGTISFFLYTYSDKLSAFLGSGRSRDLEGAMTAQKMFWKITLIAVIVGIVLNVLIVLLVIEDSR